MSKFFLFELRSNLRGMCEGVCEQNAGSRYTMIQLTFAKTYFRTIGDVFLFHHSRCGNCQEIVYLSTYESDHAFAIVHIDD